MSDYPFQLCRICFMEVVDLDSHMEIHYRQGDYDGARIGKI